MRYLRNSELWRQLLVSLLFWVSAVLAALFCFPGQTGCAAFLGALGLLVILFWLFFTVRRYRRLEHLAADADRLLHGERSLDLSQYQEGELAILANELQKLISRLQDQSDRLQKEKVYLSDSLADISHQLRTPLTSLNLLLARLPGEAGEEERRRLVYEAGQLQQRISWLVEVLLKIATLDRVFFLWKRMGGCGTACPYGSGAFLHSHGNTGTESGASDTGKRRFLRRSGMEHRGPGQYYKKLSGAYRRRRGA